MKKKTGFYRIGEMMVIFFIAFAFSMLCFSNLWNYGMADTDSSVFKYVAVEIAHGHMPYLDTFDHKGPLLYLLNYLGISISFWRGIWLIELVFLWIGFIYIYKSARLCCSARISLLAVFIASAGLVSYFGKGNYTEEYALPFITVSLYIFADYFINSKINIIRLLLCGVSFSAVLLLRPNMITLWIIMCPGVLIKCLKSKNFKEIFKYLVWFLLGGCLILIPIVAWLYKGNALTCFWNDYIEFNMFYSGCNIGRKMKALLHFMGKPLIFSALFFSVYEVIKERSFFKILNVLYLILSLLFVSISGNTFKHYGIVLIPAIVFPAAYILKDYEKSFKKMKKFVKYMAVIWIVLLTVPGWTKISGNFLGQYINRTGINVSEDIQNVAEIIKANTTEDDRITVCGTLDIIYLASDRLSATKYSYQEPICQMDKKIEEEYLKELVENRPKIVVCLDNYISNIRVVPLIQKMNYSLLDSVPTDMIYNNIDIYIKED